jgi:hypothetical protein
MGRPLVERFQNAEPAPVTVQMSPALANLLATPALVATTSAPPQVDVLGREKDIQDSQHSAHSWSQVRNAINKRAECPSVGNTLKLKLGECMEKCDSTTGCNIINYDSHTSSCMMQNCENPQNPPLKDGHDGTVWWNGTHPGPGPKPGPKPNPSPNPDCPVCPDMSQYIRLDEVPCWNCTLP